MYEKIKVTVPKTTCELLHKDALDFGIVKANKEANLNAFINLLVTNYYETFAAREEDLKDKLDRALFGIPEKYSKDALSSIIKIIADREKDDENDEKSVALSFKPTKMSEGVFLHIENTLVKNESLSSFYRRMFLSYSKKTKNEREKIIHKKSYESLCKAIKRGVRVCISLDNGHVYNEVSVYAVASARDELFNYALLYSDNKNRTFRLAKIRTVSLLLSKSEIPLENVGMFDRQILCGAQYPIYSTDNEPIKVQLSKKGVDLFNRIYLYRPTPISIEGDVYTFNCSANQALYYFERFGSEALILSPKKLGIFMRNYYFYALKKYRSIYSKD